MRRLVVPVALQVTALTLSCSSSTTPPADSAVADARSDACVVTDVDPFMPGGFRCLPAANAPAGTSCPDQRVCAQSQCPAGCEGCQSPLFCIPDTLPDGGRPSSCAQSQTCDVNGCGAGCRAVG